MVLFRKKADRIINLFYSAQTANRPLCRFLCPIFVTNRFYHQCLVLWSGGCNSRLNYDFNHFKSNSTSISECRVVNKIPNSVVRSASIRSSHQPHLFASVCLHSILRVLRAYCWSHTHSHTSFINMTFRHHHNFCKLFHKLLLPSFHLLQLLMFFHLQLHFPFSLHIISFFVFPSSNHSPLELFFSHHPPTLSLLSLLSCRSESTLINFRPLLAPPCNTNNPNRVNVPLNSSIFALCHSKRLHLFLSI